ncbi:MAG: peptidase M15 [Desulfomonile tiedjei]|uniref:Peptidase M15 n=1 Tax=Desulfomonile tiedjei TaxID=2358 RepID=A0A9D6V0H1_9BACT|nr:peptidase M15 [Desulfomonile tiedjei]
MSDQKNHVEPSPRESTGRWSEIKHFSPREFTCNCDGLCDHEDVISGELVAKLEKIRELTGMPIKVLSGARCERHNRKVGGRMRSSHIPKDNVSHGADIRCPDPEFRFAFLAAALPIFNRIGIGRDFIHVDDDPHLPVNQVWVYDPSSLADQMETP